MLKMLWPPGTPQADRDGKRQLAAGQALLQTGSSALRMKLRDHVMSVLCGTLADAQTRLGCTSTTG